MVKKVEDVAKDVVKEMATAVPNSLGLEFKKMGDSLDGRGLAFLIYGDPGSGKTTLAGTLPAGETLIINTDAGTGPLLGTDHVVFNLNESNIDEIDKLYQFLKTQKHPFKNVVVDNVSEYEQAILLSLTKGRGKEFTELREYGDCAFKLREHLHRFRDLIYDDINVVFNAWEMTLDIKTDAGLVVTKTCPKMSKKIAPEACGIVDVVGHLEVHEKSGKRWVRIGVNDQYITKTQFKGLDDGEVADFPAMITKLKEYNYGEVKDG